MLKRSLQSRRNTRVFNLPHNKRINLISQDPHPLARLQRKIGNNAVRRLVQSPSANVPHLQREIRVRWIGRTADRRQEFVERLNAQSAAIQYRLEGFVLRFQVLNEDGLTHFDRQMRDFIRGGTIIPMRLIPSAARVDGQNVLIDYFDLGYVDIDDLLASDNTSFQMNLIHILVERARVRNYARRLGTHFSDAEFNRAHRAGIDAEAEYLRNVIGDPTIRFNYEEERPNGTMVFAFRSQEGYRVFHVFRRAGRAEVGGQVWVRTRDGRRLTIDQLRAERAAAAPAPAAGGP